ncbi:MAG: hypothetical protein R3B48_02200 [Kofleriaceae bacterium]
MSSSAWSCAFCRRNSSFSSASGFSGTGADRDCRTGTGVDGDWCKAYAGTSSVFTVTN